MVERRLERAAEDARSHPAQAKFTPLPSFQRRLESRRAGQDVRRMTKATLAKITHTWSFPPGGNAVNRPLDSSFRWNDDENDDGGKNSGRKAGIQRFIRYMPTNQPRSAIGT